MSERGAYNSYVHLSTRQVSQLCRSLRCCPRSCCLGVGCITERVALQLLCASVKFVDIASEKILCSTIQRRAQCAVRKADEGTSYRFFSPGKRSCDVLNDIESGTLYCIVLTGVLYYVILGAV